MVGGESTNNGYKPDWRYDMTGGGVKKKSEPEVQVEPEVKTEEICDCGDYVPDWPYDMTGGKTKNNKTEAAESVEETVEAEEVEAVAEDSFSDYVPDWSYDMTGGKTKSNKSEVIDEKTEAAESVAETTAEESVEAVAEEPSSDYVPDWPYDMTGGKTKSHKAESADNTGCCCESDVEKESCCNPEPEEETTCGCVGKGEESDYVPDWPYDMTGGKSKSHKNEAAGDTFSSAVSEAVTEDTQIPEAEITVEKVTNDKTSDATDGISKGTTEEATEKDIKDNVKKVKEESAGFKKFLKKIWSY